MAEAYDKGKAYELHVAKLVRRKADKGSMRNKGSHTNGSYRSDIYTSLPIHLEAKHHENIRIKEWMAQAEAAKAFHETAVVAFGIDGKDYACLNLSDLLDLFVQIADQQREIQDLHAPQPAQEAVIKKSVVGIKTVEEAREAAGNAAKRKESTKLCRNGHICDDYGYCMQLSCKFSRGYRPPKVKKGK